MFRTARTMMGFALGAAVGYGIARWMLVGGTPRSPRPEAMPAAQVPTPPATAQTPGSQAKPDLAATDAQRAIELMHEVDALLAAIKTKNT